MLAVVRVPAAVVQVLAAEAEAAAVATGTNTDARQLQDDGLSQGRTRASDFQPAITAGPQALYERNNETVVKSRRAASTRARRDASITLDS